MSTNSPDSETFNSIAQEPLLEATLKRTCQEVIRVIGELIDTRNSYVALYDAASDTIEYPVYIERGRLIPDKEKTREHPAAPRRLRECKGLTDWVIEHRRPLLINQGFESATRQLDIQVFSVGTKCWLGAPMILREEVTGVIGLQNFEREEAYDEGHRDLLMTIASQAAVAIANVRALGRAQEAERRLADERKKRLHLFQKISDRMTEVVADPDIVLELVVQAANDVTQSVVTSVYVYDDSTGSFTGGVSQTRGGSVEEVLDHDLPESGGQIAMAAEHQHSIYESEARPTSFTKRYEATSFAALPLKVATDQGYRRTVGVLVVNFRGNHAFPDEEQEILAHLASQAAIAIAYTEARSSATANEQLALLGSATAALQHRLGNTINITLPAVQRLRYRIGDDPVIEEILNTIERNTLFANEVIRRMQTPLRQKPFVPTNINSLLNTAVLHCVENAGRFPHVRLASNVSDGQGIPALEPETWPEIHVKAVLSPDLPETYASVGPLQEVFRALVENAIKAIYPQAGQVVVESKLRSGGRRPLIEITVIDDGKGIEDKVKMKLFRQPVPRKEFGEGAGLGLWLSNIVVRSHRGSIRLQGTELGKGSVFLVQLPVLTHPPIVARQDGEDS